MGNFIVFTAFAIIGAWAFWCVMSARVRDGVIGKILYTVISLAAFSGAVHQYGGSFTMTPYLAILGALSLLAVRHFIMSATKNKGKR